MKKRGIKLLSFMLVFVIFTSILMIGSIVIAAETSAGTLGLSIEFTEETYIPGETATANIYITGAEDEADKKLVGVGVYVKMGKGLSFTDNDGSLNEELKIEEAPLYQIKNSPYQQGIILIDYAISNTNSGPALKTLAGIDNITDDDKILLATLNFKIANDFSGSTISIALADKVPFGTSGVELDYDSDLVDDQYDAFDVKYSSDDVTADIKNQKAVIKNGEFTYSSGTVTAEPEIYVNNASDGFLIAKLYDKTTNYLAAPISVKPLNHDVVNKLTDDKKLTFSTTVSKDNLELRYFVWDTMTTMRALCDTVTYPISE